MDDIIKHIVMEDTSRLDSTKDPYKNDLTNNSYAVSESNACIGAQPNWDIRIDIWHVFQGVIEGGPICQIDILSHAQKLRRDS
jgi:hypothetical protein